MAALQVAGRYRRDAVSRNAAVRTFHRGNPYNERRNYRCNRERRQIQDRGRFGLSPHFGGAGLLATPLIAWHALASTRDVSDVEIVIGCMTDLSGVTAVQGTNNAHALRMAFDEANEKGGIHGRKVRLVLEDMQYIVPKAVQAMNKLLNLDNIFFALANGGTPHNDAVLPAMIEKQVPNVFPLTCARSMYEPLNRYKYGQFSSYYDDTCRSEALR